MIQVLVVGSVLGLASGAGAQHLTRNREVLVDGHTYTVSGTVQFQDLSGPGVQIPSRIVILTNFDRELWQQKAGQQPTRVTQLALEPGSSGLDLSAWSHGVQPTDRIQVIGGFAQLHYTVPGIHVPDTNLIVSSLSVNGTAVVPPGSHDNRLGRLAQQRVAQELAYRGTAANFENATSTQLDENRVLVTGPELGKQFIYVVDRDQVVQI